MSQLNNFSVLPFYKVTTLNPTPQECKKWWAYGEVWPLVCGGIPAFQVMGGINGSMQLCPYEPNSGSDVSYTLSPTTKTINGTVYAVFGGTALGIGRIGRYYLRCTYNGYTYVSDVFTIVPTAHLNKYLKLEWWDDDDLITDDGAIVYVNGGGSNIYKNTLYLPTDLAKPEYVFEEEGENRDGYFFPIKQISEKRYRFRFLAPEYILDVMRFIRMSDHIQITYKGQVYNADTFLMTPTWEGNGDLANVECEFDTNTVAKKIGRLATP